ncbi:hypothetical protein [Pseudooceanicola onchidii]|uniref:hypothetical protein n=1 Tax=Pseudooceanicola onchidii TaxID=2562279 RepID=UPI0010A9E02D|nr:hypothetical protein [Pseudooceanicola onchidii]
MFPKPTSYDNGNNHRLVHFFDQKIHGDFERIEDILADASRHTRAACEAISQLPYEAFKPLQRWSGDLGKHLEKNSLLSEGFLHAARSALCEIAKLEVELAPGLIDDATRHLRDALEASYRVSDLLAAEQAIAKHRGNRN